MPPRDEDDAECNRDVCRDTFIDLVLAGQAPNERTVEVLLDRLGAVHGTERQR